VSARRKARLKPAAPPPTRRISDWIRAVLTPGITAFG
jgi:hypothetical protein